MHIVWRTLITVPGKSHYPDKKVRLQTRRAKDPRGVRVNVSFVTQTATSLLFDDTRRQMNDDIENSVAFRARLP